MTSLRLTNIRKAFDKTVAVADVSFEVPSGSLFFLLGPSGCGKTTILRMIAGFVEPTAGSIHFGERDVTSLPPEKRNAGMVFQNYALWPHMTVGQNVGFGLDVRSMPAQQKAKRIGESLELVRMSGLADRVPNQLSGGQQQRVALARAIAFRPDLLLLDEPLSNLDAKLRLEMRAEIRRISNELRMTMVYVTHDQHEALSLADKVAVMSGGHIEQLASSHEIYHRPRTKFVAEFIGETNFISGTIQGGCDADGFAAVETPIGKLRGFVPPARRSAKEVVFSIRPEAIAVEWSPTASHPATTPAIDGKCIESVYLGAFAQHAVDVRGVRIKVMEANPARTTRVGESVRMMIGADQVVGVED